MDVAADRSAWKAWKPLASRPWAPWLRATRIVDELVSIPTSDGLVLHAERLHPRTRSVRGAVILCHGLGSNGLALNFPQRSLAVYLAHAGFDCFIPDLRGAGRSTRPASGWSLDAYIDHDVPSLIEAVRSTSGCDRVHWVGHSMGGMLLMLHLMEHPDAPVDRVVAVGSALDYRPGSCFYKQLLPFRKAIARVDQLPFGLLSHWLSPLAGSGPLLPTEAINLWRPNVERAVARTLLAHGFETIPVPLLMDLATVFDEAGLARRGGSLPCLKQADRVRQATCLIAGSRDAHCPIPAVEVTASLLSNATERQLLRFGRDHGHGEEYGHFDLLVGRRAEREVWPAIRRWLEGERVA